MNTNDNFKEFAEENLKSIPHPTRNSGFDLPQVSSLCDLLYCFLNFECDEPSLLRLKQNFESNFCKVYLLDRLELPSAIEGLATTFESFLRKLAYIKYPFELWQGNEDYKGIAKCTLYDLIVGKLPPKDPKSNLPDLDFPAPLVSGSGVSKAILDFVRGELRNAVHSARNYNRTQLIQYSNLVLGAYLIAVYDNKKFLQLKFFPEFNYLEGIVRSKEYNKVHKNYIDLLGKEEILDYDAIAIEQMDGQRLLASLEFTIDHNEEDELFQHRQRSEIARVDSVVNIAKDTDRFFVIGEPGSGKTTTLQKILFDSARNFLASQPNSHLPIYIKASSYSENKSFKQLIEDEVQFALFDELEKKYPLLILIDGLNEIEDAYKRRAFTELKWMLEKHSKAHFILSSRTFGFNNDWGLQIFELKRFNESQIKQLIIKVSGDEKGDELWLQVEGNRQILELAHNPLMLMMIIAVSSKSGNKIPPNKGILYQLFNDTILAREKRFYKTDVNTKKDVLSYLAFWMRSNGIFKSVHKAKAKILIQEKLLAINHSVGANELLYELSDNNFFIDKGDDLEFYHETHQEYFVALEIKNQFFSTNNFHFDYSDPRWFEPLLICSDLFSQESDLLRFFEIIYVGDKNASCKPFAALTADDVNPRFYVACKVAYNLKELHPSIYKTAERYLLNYFAFWSLKGGKNKEVIPFNDLLKATAALSSAMVFDKLFLKLEYLFSWLQNSKIDSREVESLPEADKSLLHSQCQVFVNHLNDFPLLYGVLTRHEAYFMEMHALSRSVYYNIQLFTRYLIKNVPINQLVQTFRETYNREILFQIGKSDLDFFLENYVFVSEFEKEEVFEFIIQYHLSNKVGLEYLFSYLVDSAGSLSTRAYVLKNLLQEMMDQDVLFQTLKKLYQKSDPVLSEKEILALLNRYPTSFLERFNLESLFKAPAIQVQGIKAFVRHKDEQNLFLEVPGKSSNDFSSHLGNISFDGRAIKFGIALEGKFFFAEKKVMVLQGPAFQIKACYNRFGRNGKVNLLSWRNSNQIKRFNYQYQQLFLSKNGDKLLVHLDEDRIKAIISILDRFPETQIKIGCYDFRVKGFGTHHTSTLIKCSLDELPDESEFVLQFNKVYFDLENPFLYHRDLLKDSQILMQALNSLLKSKTEKTIDFITQLGMSYLFPELDNKHFGVVINSGLESTKAFKIYDINERKILDLPFIEEDPSENLLNNDLVVIEKNYIIHRVKKEDVPPSLFIESEIVDLSEDGAVGFIRAGDGCKDYYFSTGFCDFTPKLGDLVKFIPGINSSKKYSDKPAAYCISFVSFVGRHAAAIRFHRKFNYFDVWLKDLQTDLRLFSRVYDSQVVEGFDGHLQEGMIFSYSIPEKFASVGGTPRVYLRSLETRNLVLNSVKP
ncbi:NACHT domain-containing protein [Flaviaesturariibacter amylovorans]|uniref:NACHT domain-containing protein n=1 Tax=Flaviaesturariibacter amylovorans TaxID=1084520 RepID=A0ABP8H4W0_9BACT